MTLFNITKDVSQKLLISWPWIVNELCAGHPSPGFPESTHLSQILHEDGTLKGIYLDLSNMFHNLPLPRHFPDLLPLLLVRFGDLPVYNKQHISEVLRWQFISPNEQICPSQVTTPLGFSFSVILAQDYIRNIIKESYSTIHIRLNWESKELQFF